MKHFEGLYLKTYVCPGGKKTIGYGHTAGVLEGQTITEKQAEAFLLADLAGSAADVDRIIKVPLNENQHAALTSFTFNLGSGNLSSSTLAKRLNAGEDPCTVAREELPKWRKAGG